jgi:hypothetical protein
MSAREKTNQERKATLRAVVEAYFGGLAAKDLSGIPYHDNVVMRAPLAPGGSEVPLRGKQAVLTYLNGVLPVLGQVRILEWYVNDDLTGACGYAEIEVTNPKTKLRVADRFKVDANGNIVEQENHYDPRGLTG